MRAVSLSKALWVSAAFLAVPALLQSTARAGDEDPVVASPKQSQAFPNFPPKPLEQRIPVTIYEFHGGVQGVSVSAATDIFTTTLIESRQFRVVERNRL